MQNLGSLVNSTQSGSHSSIKSQPIQLRPYQREIVEAVANSDLARQLIVAGTGAGKTVIAAAIMKDALSKGTKSLFLTHRKTLLTQAASELAQFNLPLSLIGSGSQPDWSQPVQVASLQTLTNWSQTQLSQLNDFEQIVFDECHLTNWFTIAQYFCPLLPQPTPFKVIGLTATPWRRCKYQSLADYYETRYLAPLPSVLIEQGYLSPFVYFSINKISRNGLKIEKNGEYEKLGQKRQVNTPEYIDKVIQEWRRLAPGRPTIAFAVDIEHAHAIASSFTKAGIPAEAVDGTMSLKKRRKIYRRLEDGATQVVVSCEALSEGFNVRKVSAIILWRLTRSRAKYYQQIGRGSRTWEGKINCVVLDAVGLIDENEFGFIEDLEDEDFEIFESAKRIKKGKTPKRICVNCSGYIPASLRVCPHCDYEFPLAEKEHDSAVFSSMGLKIPRSQLEKVKFYHELLREAFEQQKSFNWCDRNYKMRYGEHPYVHWRKGAIFGGNPTSEQQQAYQTYLMTIASQCNLSQDWIQNNQWEF